MRHMVFILSIGLLTACSGSKEEKPDSTEPAPEVVQPDAPKHQLHVIAIKGMLFHPEEIKVKAGDTIRWNNLDIVDHCITEEKENRWTSAILLKDSTWQLVATKSEDYFCALHQVMKGRITVE